MVTLTELRRAEKVGATERFVAQLRSLRQIASVIALAYEEDIKAHAGLTLRSPLET